MARALIPKTNVCISEILHQWHSCQGSAEIRQLLSHCGNPYVQVTIFKMWSFPCWFSHGVDSILQELQRKPEHPGVVNLYFPERCKPNCSKEKQMNRKTLSGMWSVYCVVSCGNTHSHKTWGWDWCSFVYASMFFLIKMSQHLPLFQNGASKGSCVYSGNQPFSLAEGSRYILSIKQTQFCC